MINTLTYSLEDGEKGVMVFFPGPFNVKSNSQYIISFDTPIILPNEDQVIISFDPADASYSIYGSSLSSARIFVKIKTLKKIQTKTLLRLTIKDLSNQIIHTDYIMISCSPQNSYTVEGYVQSSTIVNGLGPNGGSVIQLTNAAQNTNDILVGSIVSGGGLTNINNLTVRSIINFTSFELNRSIENVTNIPGPFTLTNNVDCIDPNSVDISTEIPTYIVLDRTNNWTYKVKNQVIAKFVLLDKFYADTVVLLPIKNQSLLASYSDSAPIPQVSMVKIGGRVINDTVCVNTI